MKIGILGAMPEEVRELGREMVGVRKEIVGNREYRSGQLFGTECVTVFSRWGKVAAASTATTLIDRFGAELLIFTGVAGAADPELAIGDIVIADSLIQHDVDASASGLFEQFEIPLLGLTHLRLRPELVAAASRAAATFVRHDLGSEAGRLAKAELHALPRIVTGTIASGDQFIASAERLAGLRRSIDNLRCVEMEGAAVGQICHEHGVPIVVIRAISDKADHSAATDFPKFVEHVASFYSWGIVKHLIADLTG